MFIKAAIVEDDGITPVLDKVTGEAHAMEFPLSPYVMKVIETWSAGQTTSQVVNGETVTVPKFSNAGKIIQDVLFGTFNTIEPQVRDKVAAEMNPFAEEQAAIQAAMIAIEAKKLALFAPPAPVDVTPVDATPTPIVTEPEK